MGDYEIRILKTDGRPSLVYACSHMSDAGAIRSARNIAREPGDRIEVWRGMSCIHREDGLQLPLARSRREACPRCLLAVGRYPSVEGSPRQIHCQSEHQTRGEGVAVLPNAGLARLG